jgi:hypothetical protein
VRVGWRHAPGGHFSGRWGGAPVLAKKENVSIRRQGPLAQKPAGGLEQGVGIKPASWPQALSSQCIG